jgi:tetratricopeptide (TPR) repeat protein
MVHRDRAGAQHESFQARLADTVVRWLNSVFGAEPGAAALWAISDAQLGPAGGGGGGGGAQMEESIAATLIRKFRGGLAQAERQARVDLRSLIDLGRVFRRLLTCCMIDLSPEALERVCASIPWPADKALRADDLLGVRPRLRSVSEIAVSAADNAMNQALAAKDIESARRWASLARAKYREALALNPNSTIAVMNLGALFFYVLRDIPAALRCFERAIELNPLDANAHDNLAMVHRFGTRNHALAKASYEKALEINPKHLNNMLQFLTFLITELKGMTHPLVREFEQTDRFVLESSGYRGMGTVAIFYQYVKKDLDKAEHFYREAVRQSRGDPQVCCNLALFLYKERKNFEEARQVLEQVMRSRPGFEAAVTAYCDLLASLGATDREKAVSIAGDFLLSAKLHHSQAALLAASLSSLGQGQRAMALLEDSLTRAPWSAELLDQLAQVTLSTTQDAKQA